MARREQLRMFLVPIFAVIAGLLVGAILMQLSGANPLVAYQAAYKGVFGSPRLIGNTLTETIPLIFTGLAVSLAFRCGLFNIGVEGQFLMAQVSSAWVGYAIAMPAFLPPILANFIHPTLALLAGALAGAVWAGVVGLLKAYRGVHEVINSIMLNYVALFLAQFLLLRYMKGPVGSATHEVLPTAILQRGMIEGSTLHTGLWVALLMAVVVWAFLWKTAAGYEIRSVGLSPGAAEYAGISVKRNIINAMGLSGALGGLAGAVQVLGVNYKFFETMAFIGFGFNGIAVALVGRNHPLGVVLAAFLFGALERGGRQMQVAAQVPRSIILVVQGVIIFFVAAEGIWTYLQTKKGKAAVKL